ncbi:MAG TPA: glycosyltransferase [Candidatus Limnocylindria bacterium]|nr:glycosyltransferase [Candidatus Limnocylindria bacterium]
MRVLFTSLPAIGHLHSLLPLAVASRIAGHEVAICTAESLGSIVASHGLRHLPGGADSLAELMGPDLPRDPVRRAVWVAREVFAKAAPDRLMPDVRAQASAWRPDLIVRESTEFAGCLLAEQAGLPHVAIATGSRSARLDDVRRFAASLPDLRARHGLDPDPDHAMHTRHMTISFVPARWDGDAPLPATLRQFRFEPPPSREALLTEMPDGTCPIVLAALGTLFHGSAGLLEAIIEALGTLPVDAIVAAGRGHDPARFAGAPANVTVVDWVPQLEVLARTALFVTHGGFNSTKEALSLGVPLVVIPIGADQFYTAERVEALGLGRSIGPEDRRASAIRQTVAEVMASDLHRRRAAEFAAEMAALPPIDEAVVALEGLVAGWRTSSAAPTLN